MTHTSERLNACFEDEYGNCLFRYRRVTNFNLESLVANRAHFIPPAVFRDPYDTMLFADSRRIVSCLGGKTGSADSYVEGAKILIKRNSKVLCFSENYDSMLMWAQYADNHRGYVLIYDKDDLKDAGRFDAEGFSTEKGTALEKVEYVSRRVDLTDIVKTLIQNDLFGATNAAEDEDGGIDQGKIRRALIQKASDRSYEKEWRLISEKISFWRHSPLNYIECRPKGLILGSHCAEEDAEELAAIAEQNGIKVFRMEMEESEQRFGMKVCEA